MTLPLGLERASNFHRWVASLLVEGHASFFRVCRVGALSVTCLEYERGVVKALAIHSALIGTDSSRRDGKSGTPRHNMLIVLA